MEEEVAADWDLLAVVRGFTSTVAAAAAPPAPPEVVQPPPDHFDRSSQNPFFSEHPQQIMFRQENYPSNTAASSVFTLTSELAHRDTLLSAPTPTCSTPSQTHQRSKKRKSLQKRVCHVPVEGLSSDMWAWRKYGQKPIKGSPYPRGYYKCSSSKGCPARKQVERNKSEPKMFIITYTSEHNHPIPTHRNSLAGSTRLKPAAAAVEDDAEKGDTIKEETGKENNDSGDELELKEMVMNDDFFVGFEDLNDDSDYGDMFSDQIQGNSEEQQ